MAGRQRAVTGSHPESSFIEWPASKSPTRKALLPIPLSAESSSGRPALNVTQSASPPVKEGPFLAPWNQRLLNGACQVFRRRRAGKGCGETRRGFLHHPQGKTWLLVRAAINRKTGANNFRRRFCFKLRPEPGSRVNTLQQPPKGRARRKRQTRQRPANETWCDRCNLARMKRESKSTAVSVTAIHR